MLVVENVLSFVTYLSSLVFTPADCEQKEQKVLYVAFS